MNNPNHPLGSALHAAATARQDTREKVLGALRRGEGDYAARQAHATGQEAIRHHRARALNGARVVVDREMRRLFSGTQVHTRSDPAREHAEASRVATLLAGLDTEAAAAKAMDRLLSAAHHGDNLALAGGLAAAALDRGWERVLSAWVEAPALGARRGGWATVARIREAKAMLAGDLPPVLADLPPLEEMAAGFGR